MYAVIYLSFSFSLPYYCTKLTTAVTQLTATERFWLTAATADGSIFSSQLRELCNHVLAASLTTLSHSFLLQSGSFKLLVLLGMANMKYGLWTMKFIS